MNEKKNRKTSKYMLILTIVTVCCILIGSGRHLFGFFSEDPVGTAKASLEEFDSIDLDMDIGDVQIVRGEEFSWTGEFPSKLMPNLSVSGKQLRVTQNSGKSFGLNGQNKSYKLVITVPEGAVIKTMEADMDVGAFSSEEVEYGKAEIDLDVGSLTLTNCSFDYLDGNVDVGSIEADGCSMREVRLVTDVGEITVDGEEYGTKYKK